MTEPRPVLVTGAAGFIGAYVMRALAERGIENGFPFFDFHFDAGGLQEDRVDRAGGQRVLLTD